MDAVKMRCPSCGRALDKVRVAISVDDCVIVEIGGAYEPDAPEEDVRKNCTATCLLCGFSSHLLKDFVADKRWEVQ